MNEGGPASPAGMAAAQAAGPGAAQGPEDGRLIAIEVVYAEPHQVWRVALDLPAGSTAAQALAASGFARQFPDYSLQPPMTGVYGRSCAPDHVLQDADRLEIYRPLDFDPLESRRRRASHRQARAGQARVRRKRALAKPPEPAPGK